MAGNKEANKSAESDGGDMDEYDEQDSREENDEEHIDGNALEASIKANIEKCNRNLFGPLPTVTIPPQLYKKAQDQQDQLTQEERALFLSRGDLIGKALAKPSSLTDIERNIVLDRQSPDKE